MRSRRIIDALIGAVAAALGLGLSELVAGVLGGVPSLIESLGGVVIDHVPPAVKDFAIETFGTNDKLVLVISIVVVAVLLGALIGAFARDRFWVAIVGFLAFGLVAAWAGAVESGGALGLAVIPAGLAALGGLFVIDRLMRTSRTPGDEEAADPGRRKVLVGLGAVSVIAAMSAGLGRSLLEQAKKRLAGREEVVLPEAAELVGAVPAAAELGVPGLSPIVTSNADFYRIDTALTVPRVDLEAWTLSVAGRVDRPYTITYDELLEMRMVERHVTLSCVSNRVGGDLVGTAKWLGVPLSEILDRAGVQPNAEQLVGRSVDGFTVGFPTEAAFDGREALVAVGMNDEPLPFEHGFPARLVVAGLYGYVSATKWLSEIELTGWDEFDAYWVPRGWSKEAPIKTQSRIDTPRVTDRLERGLNVASGVAWAPNRGISKVEVQVGDGGPWVEAELSQPLSENTWVQWRLEFDAPPGLTRLQVRATDGDGNLQDERQRPPAPDGATGYHAVSAFVADG